MPPKGARQSSQKSSDKPKGEASQQLQSEPYQAHQLQAHPTSSTSLIPAEIAPATTKGASLPTKSLHSDQPKESGTKPTSSSLLSPATVPNSSSVGARRSQRNQRLASSTSTALSPTLSSSAKAAGKPISRSIPTLPLAAATLSSPELVAAASYSSPKKIKDTAFSHIPKAPEPSGRTHSGALQDLGILQEAPVNGYRAISPETNIKLDEPQALDREQVLATSMSEVTTVLLRSNCYGLEFAETVYKYEIGCEASNILAKGERRLVEKAFLQELSIEHQKGSIAFINGHTFLTSKLYHGLENYPFVGTINRRLEKPDLSFKPVFLKRGSGEAGKVTKVWSSFVKGTCLDDVWSRKSMPFRSEEAHFGSQLIAVRAFVEVQEFDPATIHSFLGEVGDQPEIARLIQALGCLISRGSANKNKPTSSNFPSLVLHGSKVYDFTLPGNYLGYGLELRTGANSSIRTTHQKILRAVLPCHRLFYRSITVSGFFEEHLPGSCFTSNEVIATVQVLLRGLRVRLQRSDGESRIATISGIAKTTPAETFFDLQSANGCRTISVFEYFVKYKGVRMTHPDHPCLIFGSEERRQYVPTCVCEIIQGQSFKQSIPKEALMKANQLKNILTPKANPPSGLYGDENPVDLLNVASSLDAISLHEGVAGPLPLFPEQVECQKIIKSAAYLPMSHSGLYQRGFRVIFVEVGNAPALSKTVDVFLRIFRRRLRDLNLSTSPTNGKTHTLKQSASLESWQKDLDEVLNLDTDSKETEDACLGSTHMLRPFVVAFIEESRDNPEIHNKIKHLCDLRLGLQSCCVKLSTLDKIHQQNTDNGIDRYACSLLRKMFAKLRTGFDDEDPDDSTGTPISNATLLVGAHVAVVPGSHTVTYGQGVNVACQVYCITLSSKPIGCKGTYSITTVLKKATSPEALGLDVLLNAHLDEHEKPRVQLSSLSRLVFYRSGSTAPSRESAWASPASRVDFQPEGPPEGLMPRPTVPNHQNSSPASRGRTGSSMPGPFDFQQSNLTGEAQSSRNNTERNNVPIITAAIGSIGRKDGPQRLGRRNDAPNVPLSKTASVHPSEQQNQIRDTPERGNPFQKETERLESAVKSRYPCARLFYISVSSNTKLRLFNTTNQPLVKTPLGPDEVHQNVSWIASDGLTNPNDNEWFMLKGLTATNSQKPLQLSCHSMPATGTASSLENDLKKNYEDTFDASYDYPCGLAHGKTVAPIYFARLATRRALLLMDRNDHTSDTAPFKLRPVHSALRDTLYYI